MARFDSGITWDSGARYDSADTPEPEPNPPPLGTMRDLTRFLVNPFDDPGISLAELMAFATDHLERMVVKNPGNALDARIAATTPALETVAACAGDDQVKLGVRRARKAAKDAFRAGLPEQTRRIEATLQSVFGVGSAQVQEAFPNGRTIFSVCTDDLLATHLQPMNTVVVANAAQLAPVIVTLSAGMVSTWNALHTQSETATAAKANTEAEKRAARAALQLQLYLNLAKLMELFPRQPEKLPEYMQQHLLEDRPTETEDETPPPPPVPPL